MHCTFSSRVLYLRLSGILGDGRKLESFCKLSVSVLHPPCWTYGLSFPDLPLSLASDLCWLPCGLPGQFEDHVRRAGKLSSAVVLPDYIVFSCFQEETLSTCTDSLLEGTLYQIMNVSCITLNCQPHFDT